MIFKIKHPESDSEWEEEFENEEAAYAKYDNVDGRLCSIEKIEDLRILGWNYGKVNEEELDSDKNQNRDIIIMNVEVNGFKFKGLLKKEKELWKLKKNY